MRLFFIIIIVVVSLPVNGAQLNDFDPLKELELNPPFYQFWHFVTPSEADVKKKFRALSLKWHPDKNKSKNAEQKFQSISKAHEMLKGNGFEAIERRQNEASKYHCGEWLLNVLNTFKLFLDYAGRSLNHANIVLSSFRNNPSKYLNLFLDYLVHTIFNTNGFVLIFCFWLLIKVVKFILYLLQSLMKKLFVRKISDEVN
jgi:hypothetical protein